MARVNQGKPARTRVDRKAVISFEEAMAKRTVPRDAKAIRRTLFLHNYVRMRRMERDIVWLKRTLQRMGLNPEDWSTYL
jgi:hypothetical protein